MRTRGALPALPCLALSCLAPALQGCATVTREMKQDLIRATSTVAREEISITIADSFIEAYKDRVTIDVMFDLDRIDLLPHPAFWDGDLHIAGRSAEVGLPIVAELKNAAFEREALERGILELRDDGEAHFRRPSRDMEVAVPEGGMRQQVDAVEIEHHVDRDPVLVRLDEGVGDGDADLFTGHRGGDPDQVLLYFAGDGGAALQRRRQT